MQHCIVSLNVWNIFCNLYSCQRVFVYKTCVYCLIDAVLLLCVCVCLCRLPLLVWLQTQIHPVSWVHRKLLPAARDEILSMMRTILDKCSTQISMELLDVSTLPCFLILLDYPSSPPPPTSPFSSSSSSSSSSPSSSSPSSPSSSSKTSSSSSSFFSFSSFSSWPPPSAPYLFLCVCVDVASSLVCVQLLYGNGCINQSCVLFAFA